MAGFAERRGDLKPRNAGSFQNVEKARRGILPWNVQEEGSVADTETWAHIGLRREEEAVPLLFPASHVAAACHSSRGNPCVVCRRLF